MPASRLNSTSKRELLDLAKQRRIAGRSKMTKQELVAALSGHGVPADAGPVQNSPHAKRGRPRNKNKIPNGSKKSKPLVTNRSLSKDQTAQGIQQDLLVAQVCDSFWIRVQWQLSRHLLTRAEVALGHEWINSVATLRLIMLSPEETKVKCQQTICDVPIRIDGDCWYMQIGDSRKSYRVELGFTPAEGHFHPFLHCNVLPIGASETSQPLPIAKHLDGLPKSAAVKASRVAQLSNGRIVSVVDPYSAPPAKVLDGRFDSSNENGLQLELDAEVLVFGKTHPDAKLTIHETAIPVERDGSFAIHFPIEDGRQILPAEATARDGQEQQTVVLAIERNTRRLEPQRFDKCQQ